MTNTLVLTINDSNRVEEWLLRIQQTAAVGANDDDGWLSLSFQMVSTDADEDIAIPNEMQMGIRDKHALDIW